MASPDKRIRINPNKRIRVNEVGTVVRILLLIWELFVLSLTSTSSQEAVPGPSDRRSRDRGDALPHSACDGPGAGAFPSGLTSH